MPKRYWRRPHLHHENLDSSRKPDKVSVDVDYETSKADMALCAAVYGIACAVLGSVIGAIIGAAAGAAIAGVLVGASIGYVAVFLGAFITGLYKASNLSQNVDVTAYLKDVKQTGEKSVVTLNRGDKVMPNSMKSLKERFL